MHPLRCARPKSTSKFFANVLMGNSEFSPPLTFSYATCGNLDHLSPGDEELRALSPVRGRRLRVSWPPQDNSTGFTKIAAPPGEEVLCFYPVHRLDA